MGAIMVSAADQWFSEEKAPDFPYNRTFEEAKWDPFVVLHTSGSTGLPKPVVARQGMLCISDAYHNLPEWHGLPILTKAWADMTKEMFVPSKSSYHIVNRAALANGVRQCPYSTPQVST